VTAVRLRSVRRVPWREWPALLAAVGVASLVEIGLHTMPLPALARRLGVPLALEGQPVPDQVEIGRTPGGRPALPPETLLRLNAAARVMRHWPFGDTCLRSALVSGHRMRRLRPALRVGVMRDEGTIKAHAWLEVGGASLDPLAPVAFEVMSPIGGPS
jgi:transglutaminase superfamily protein